MTFIKEENGKSGRVLLIAPLAPPSITARAIMFGRFIKLFGQPLDIVTSDFDYDAHFPFENAIDVKLSDRMIRLRNSRIGPQFINRAWSRLVGLVCPFSRRSFSNWLARCMKWLFRSGSVSRYDAVWTFSTPQPAHLAGVLAKMLGAKRWIVFMSDLHTGNPSLQDMSLLRQTIGKWVEALYLRYSDRIVVTSADTKIHLLRHFGPSIARKVSVVEHFYDSALMQTQTSEHHTAAADVVRFFGRMFSNRNADPILRALIELHESGKSHNAVNFKFEFFIDGFHGDSQILQKLVSLGIVHIRPHLSPPSALSLMRNSAALVVLDIADSPDPSFQSKLADYLSTEVPIFALTMPSSCSARIVTLAGGYIANILSQSEVTLTLESMLADLSNNRTALTNAQIQFRKTYDMNNRRKEFIAMGLG